MNDNLQESDTIAHVSVIIPCYRCASTITRAVDSVYAQTMTPIEVIIIDDNSLDNTLEEIRILKKNYPHDWIKIISLHDNVGPGEARNAGWNIAKGDYIAFLDSDDSWHSRKIEFQYEWMMHNPDVAITGHPEVVVKEKEYVHPRSLCRTQCLGRVWLQFASSERFQGGRRVLSLPRLESVCLHLDA